MALSSRRSRHERFAHRQERRLKRRRGDYRWLVAIAALALLALVGVELGRSYMYMEEVKHFAETIDKMTPDEVKSRVEQFSHQLGDRNPLIRRASMMAMKMATGWRLGKDPREWRDFWFKHGPEWHYDAGTSTPPAQAKSPWADMVPVPSTNLPSTK